MYNQTRSFNLGIAIEVSVEAAIIYDDLAYAQQVFGRGYFYRSYDQMLKRLPVWSEQTIRRHIAKLVEQGWISTKVKKIEGKPLCHYQIERSLSAKMVETMESAKLEETINIETKKETNKVADALLPELISLVNPKEKPTADRIRVLNGRLKDYTPDEIRAAARAFSKSEWHREHKQMSIDNLLAPSKFGRWFDQGVATTGTREDIEQSVTVDNQDEMVKKFKEGKL